jgi:hypothetical protein
MRMLGWAGSLGIKRWSMVGKQYQKSPNIEIKDGWIPKQPGKSKTGAG